MTKWINNLINNIGQPLIKYSEDKVAKLTQKYIIDFDSIIDDQVHKKGYFKEIVQGYLENESKLALFTVYDREFEEIVTRVANHFENKNFGHITADNNLDLGQERVKPEVEKVIADLKRKGMSREEIKAELPTHVTFLKDEALFDLFDKIYPKE